MATQLQHDRTEQIALLNDRARMGLDRTAKIVFTRTCIGAFGDIDGVGAILTQARLMKAIRACTFSNDSPERDFGVFTLDGTKVWLKVDYYDLTMDYGSNDPADASVTTRVLTVMCRVGAARCRAAPP